MVKKSNSGNVLFLILIAVALFAALSYVVTQSTRSASGNTSRESGILISAEIMNYVIGIRSGVTRLLASGTSAENLSLNSNCINGAGYIHTPAQPTRNWVFHKDGGGAICRDSPFKDTPGFPRGFSFQGGVSVVDVGTAENEIVMAVRVDRETCMAINTKSGATQTGVEPPEDDYYQYVPFQGSFASNHPLAVFGDDYLGFAGKSEICRKTSSGDFEAFFVILQR